MDGFELIRQGKLTDEPLPKVLHTLYRERFTGMVTLAAAGGRSEVYFRQGYPVGIQSNAAIDQLSRVVVEAGMTSEAACKKVAAGKTPDGADFGRQLVEGGLLSAAQLEDALRMQIRRRLHRLFFLERGDFKIQAGDHAVGNDGDFRVQPRRAIYQGIRSAWDARRLGTTLSALTGKAIHLLADPPTLAKYGFTDDDAAVAVLMAAEPITIEELITRSGQPTETVAPIVCTLLLTEALELTPAPLRPQRSPVNIPIPPPVAPLSPPPPASARPSAEAPAMRQLVSRKLAEIEKADLFQALGVSRNADREAVKSAYLAAAKAFHPDRFSAPDVVSLRPDVEKIFRRLNEAHATLIDEGRRAAYLAKLEGPPASAKEESKARNALDAELAFRQGEAHMKKREFGQAAAAFERCVELNPDEGEHLAMHTWARFSAGQQPLEAIRPDLVEALAKSPRCARAHYFLGVVLKEDGDLDKALGHFKRALELDERLAEAETEIRLITKRREKQSGKSLFGAFRKK